MTGRTFTLPDLGEGLTEAELVTWLVRVGDTVRKGDTLLRIALDFGQNYRDLVTWNNLANPDDIKVGQLLRVSPPGSERVAGNSVVTQPVPMPPSATPISKSIPPGSRR